MQHLLGENSKGVMEHRGYEEKFPSYCGTEKLTGFQLYAGFVSPS